MTQSAQSVILDFDGTVADSFAMAVEIAQTLLTEYEYPVPSQEAIYAMRELSAAQLIKVAKISPRHMPSMLRYVRREQKKIIHKVKPIEGIEPILKALSQKYTLAIISSSEASLIDDFLVKYKLRDYISDIVGGAGLFTKHRPIKRYMKQHGLGAKDVLYVGDEVRDIDAARRAGVPIVSVGWGFNGEHVIKKNHPTVYVDDPKLLGKAIDQVLSKHSKTGESE